MFCFFVHFAVLGLLWRCLLSGSGLDTFSGFTGVGISCLAACDRRLHWGAPCFSTLCCFSALFSFSSLGNGPLCVFAPCSQALVESVRAEHVDVFAILVGSFPMVSMWKSGNHILCRPLCMAPIVFSSAGFPQSCCHRISMRLMVASIGARGFQLPSGRGVGRGHGSRDLFAWLCV